MIGHEITHGFDDQGRQYDDTGNLANWWEDATKDKFLEKANCIIWQYGNYTAKAVNKTLNGVNTQGENIADNGGLKEAYRAYNRCANSPCSICKKSTDVNNLTNPSWVSRHGEEPRLPGLQDYTPKQMFWIRYQSNPCQYHLHPDPQFAQRCQHLVFKVP